MTPADPQAAPTAPRPDPPPAVRAQLLATEHWSLLATRGMTWSEVMSRITVHLTVTSASLVVLALVAQALGFGTAFRVLSIGLTSAILVLGTITGIRVHNASIEDSMLLVGMNRLRAAYVDIDWTMRDYLVTSWHDDPRGVMRSYTLGHRTLLSHIIGSTRMFMNAVNAIVAGTLGALIAHAAGGGPLAVAVIGSTAGLAYFVATIVWGRRAFGRQEAFQQETARFPSSHDQTAAQGSGP